jgi:hypothetical protein
MLIDLQWDRKHAEGRVRVSHLTGFDTTGGHLVVTFEFPKEEGKENVFTNRVAHRVARGVYISFMLENEIPNYTEWEVEHPWETSSAIFAKMKKARESGDDDAWRLAREALSRECDRNTYGNALSLKEIFKYGSRFIRSPHPYVLQVHGVDTRDATYIDRYLDKNGPLVGKHKIQDLVGTDLIHFSFHKLVKKG